MAFAERDGVELAYEASGAGDPPIVFVHGWSCDRSYFRPQAEHFAPRHQVVSVDLRGHGESDQPEEGYDIDSLADDVLAVVAAAGADRPVVVGHSLGGAIAVALAARQDAVRAAVLVDPAPLVVTPDVKGVMENVASACADDADGSWRTRFVGGMFLPTDTVRRDEILAGMPQRPAHIASAAIAGLAGFDGAAALEGCTVPLLVIGAASPSNAAEALRQRCPTITIGQTVGSGHFNQLEVPDQVNAMIDRFLRVNQLV